jgi:hypothetical protein
LYEQNVATINLFAPAAWQDGGREECGALCARRPMKPAVGF